MTTTLLSRTEEVRLARRIEHGDSAARDQLIERNVGLVTMLARSFRGRGVPFPDLVQEGTVGLIQAVERFDHRRGNKLSTYAVWWIRRALLDAVSDSRAVRVPAKANRELAAIGRARDELSRTGRAESDAAIAAITALPEARVGRLREAPHVIASLDASLGSDSRTLADLIPVEQGLDPADRVIAGERSRDLLRMLAMLPRRHRLVLACRYGIGEQGTRSHAEIGSALGVGEERSRQIEREALQRLRSIAPAFKLAA